LNDDGKAKAFTFTIPSDQEVFVGISYYSDRMYPENCRAGLVMGEFTLIGKEGRPETIETDSGNVFNHLHKDNLPKGTYTVTVDNKWATNVVKDYTVRIYAKSQITITPASGTPKHTPTPTPTPKHTPTSHPDGGKTRKEIEVMIKQAVDR